MKLKILPRNLSGWSLFIFFLFFSFFIFQNVFANVEKYDDDGELWYIICDCEHKNTVLSNEHIDFVLEPDNEDTVSKLDSCDREITMDWAPSQYKIEERTIDKCEEWANKVNYINSCGIERCKFTDPALGSKCVYSNNCSWTEDNGTITWKGIFDTGETDYEGDVSMYKKGEVKLGAGINNGFMNVECVNCDEDPAFTFDFVNRNEINTLKIDPNKTKLKVGESKILYFFIQNSVDTGIFYYRTVKINIKDPVSCASYIQSFDCTKEGPKCKNECEKTGNERCEYVGTVCQEKEVGTFPGPTSVATPGASAGSPAGSSEPTSQWSTDERLAYYEGLYQTKEIRDYASKGGAIPLCAFSGTCRNVNDLLQLIINFGSGLFAIIGSFAFAFFVYGGFTIVTSFGSPDRVKKGREIMVAAVVGMVISLSAFLLVDFMLDALNVSDSFTATEFH